MWRECTCIRTSIHGRHIPDLPCGEITIEVTSLFKHCTTAATKKCPRINMGKKKRGREDCSNIYGRISIQVHVKKGRRQRRKSEKKDPILLEKEKRVYVLEYMVVTFPTCHAERLPLKAPAPQNTAPHTAAQQQREAEG